MYSYIFHTIEIVYNDSSNELSFIELNLVKGFLKIISLYITFNLHLKLSSYENIKLLSSCYIFFKFSFNFTDLNYV